MKPKDLKIRIFGSNDCADCQKFISAMKMYSFDYEFIDAFAEETQEFCDKMDVDSLPHIQVYYPLTGEVLLNRIGYLSPMLLLQDIARESEEQSNPKNMEIRAVRSDKGSPIIPKNSNEGGCKNCGSSNEDKS